MSVAEHYATDTNLANRSNFHGRYATKNWFAWVHERLALTDAADVLDAGCGMGWFWRDQSAQRAALGRLTLLDTSSHMVTKAAASLAGLSRARMVESVVGDITDMPLAARRYDCVLAMHMLYHVVDQARAIDACARVMKPGATLAVTTNGLDNLMAINALGHAAFDGQRFDLGACLFSPERAEQLLRNRFQTVTRHDFEDSYSIVDPVDIFVLLTSFPPGHAADDTALARLAKALDALDITADTPFRDTRRATLFMAKM